MKRFMGSKYIANTLNFMELVFSCITFASILCLQVLRLHVLRLHVLHLYVRTSMHMSMQVNVIKYSFSLSYFYD